jgi:hypothetical protein
MAGVAGRQWSDLIHALGLWSIAWMHAIICHRGYSTAKPHAPIPSARSLHRHLPVMLGCDAWRERQNGRSHRFALPTRLGAGRTLSGRSTCGRQRSVTCHADNRNVSTADALCNCDANTRSHTYRDADVIARRLGYPDAGADKTSHSRINKHTCANRDAHRIADAIGVNHPDISATLRTWKRN